MLITLEFLVKFLVFNIDSLDLIYNSSFIFLKYTIVFCIFVYIMNVIHELIMNLGNGDGNLILMPSFFLLYFVINFHWTSRQMNRVGDEVFSLVVHQSKYFMIVHVIIFSSRVNLSRFLYEHNKSKPTHFPISFLCKIVFSSTLTFI